MVPRCLLTGCEQRLTRLCINSALGCRFPRVVPVIWHREKKQKLKQPNLYPSHQRWHTIYNLFKKPASTATVPRCLLTGCQQRLTRLFTNPVLDCHFPRVVIPVNWHGELKKDITNLCSLHQNRIELYLSRAGVVTKSLVHDTVMGNDECPW